MTPPRREEPKGRRARGRVAALEAWWEDNGILVVLALAVLTFVAYFIWVPAAVVLAVVTVALMVAGAHTF